jgi:hypothetical protein
MNSEKFYGLFQLFSDVTDENTENIRVQRKIEITPAILEKQPICKI